MGRPSDHAVRAIKAIAGRMLGDMDKHPVALRLQSEVNRLQQAAEALDNVMANRSPLDTPAAHALKVGRLAKKLDSEITAMINRCGAIMGESVKDIRRRIAEKVNLTPDAFASEIRAAFRTLSPAKQADLINELVEGNRGPELAAIVKAPPILSGISEDRRAVYEQMILTKHAGAELDEEAALEGVFDAAMNAQFTASAFATRLSDPSEMAGIERAAAEADAAGDAFTLSISSLQ